MDWIYVAHEDVVCCSVLRCVAVCCSAYGNVLQLIAVYLAHEDAVLCSVLQCVALCCSACCRVLQWNCRIYVTHEDAE